MLEHNVFIVWKPEYNLGIPIIDEQHRGIVTTINSLYYGMQNYYIKEMLAPIVDMIHDYTHIHFKIEEDFHEKCRFPGFTAHQELHGKLTSKLLLVGRKSMLAGDPYQFMNFLKNWWIDHICNEDLLFRNYLLKTSAL
ncbi:MAG: bacteriohemerythrin [Oscillospiraceae bacterium]|nr:bacteriohemerythrin [Oscillospiraceae bacterium]